MRMRDIVVACVVLAALPIAAGAQNLSGEFSPNPVAPGLPVHMTITDATGGGLNLYPCTWFTIHQGTQNGPVIDPGFTCNDPLAVVQVPPNGSNAFIWDQLSTMGLVPPGRYWFEVNVWDATFSQQYVEWFCLSIQDPSQPRLTTPEPLAVGAGTLLTIADPMAPNGFYFVALSRTSNNPFSVAGLDFCLSPDSLFLTSLVAPGALLGNQAGMLDGVGEAWPGILVPNDPALAYQGFHVQGLTSDGGSLRTTNDLSFSIRP